MPQSTPPWLCCGFWLMIMTYCPYPQPQSDDYHGRSWKRMKDCPRLRTMLSLLDAELGQILSVNKELRCQGSKCGGATTVCQAVRNSADLRSRVGSSSGSRESGDSICHPSSAHTRTHPPFFRFFVANARTVPTHARCHPYVRIGKGPNGYRCE